MEKVQKGEVRRGWLLTCTLLVGFFARIVFFLNS